MDRDQWLKIKAFAQHLAGMSDAEKYSWLFKRCAGNQSMIDEVLKLVRSEEEKTQAANRPKPKHDPPMSGSLAGMVLGQWRLLREIGSGGMGSVWLAERACAEFRMLAAVKLIKHEVADEELVKRFRRERQILADLKHPNIATLYDGGTTKEGLPYLVMEYVDGENIVRYCLKQNANLRSKLSLFRDLCRAVAYAHRKGVLHRDIKPSNILVSDSGIAKLLDFGIAGYEHPEVGGDLTLGRMTPMTPDYASPERLKGRTVTEADDIYALGLVLFYLLTGRHPRKVAGNWEVALRAMQVEQPQDSLLSACVELLSRVLGPQQWRLPTADALASEVEDLWAFPSNFQTLPHPPTKPASTEDSDHHDTITLPSLDTLQSQQLPLLKVEPDPPAQKSREDTTGSTHESEKLAGLLSEADQLAKYGVLDLALEFLEEANALSPQNIAVTRRFKSLYLRMGKEKEAIECLELLIENRIKARRFSEAADYAAELEAYDRSLWARHLMRIDAAAELHGLDPPAPGFQLDFENKPILVDEPLDLFATEAQADVLDLRNVRIYENHARDVGCPSFADEWSLDIPNAIQQRAAQDITSRDLATIDTLMANGDHEIAKGLIEAMQVHHGNHPELLRRLKSLMPQS